MPMPEPDEGMFMPGPIVTLMDVLKGGNVRSGALLNLIILTLLLFVTISDVAFKSSSSSSSTSTSTGKASSSSSSSSSSYYSYSEELSGEVLYPPYSYSNRADGVEGGGSSNSISSINSSRQQTKGLLGSAMMQSVTEALSPILPFAGGVDLRRDENWKSWNSWLALWGGNSNHQDMNIKYSSKSKSNHNDQSDLNLDRIVAVPRGGGGGGQQNNRNGRINTNNNNTGKKKRDFQTKVTLSTPEPFLSTSDISKMTLEEIAIVFQYAMSSGDQNMDASTFLKQNFSKHVDKNRLTRAINAIADATTKSRGAGVVTAKTFHCENRGSGDNKALSERNGFGDVDALEFCAAMRILAEWRLLRQTPPGFKGYAVGMNLGHKDVVQNIVKIESVVHDWIEKRAEVEATKRSQRDCDGEESCEEAEAETDNLRSPTLRELLQYEIDADVHPTSKLPRLKEKTAAMGLLWVRRQLQYQTALFSNIISVPDVYPTIIDAVGDAYSEVYGHLHGWTVQKIFNYSFQSAPDADLIFRHMNPYKLEKVTVAARNGEFINRVDMEIDDTKETTTLASNDEFLESFEHEAIPESVGRIVLEDEENNNPIQNFFSHVGSEWDKLGKQVGDEIDKLGHQIGGEWDKIICNLSKVFDEHGKECKVNNLMDTRGGASSRNKGQNNNEKAQISDEEVDAHIAREMAADARQHILAYLNIAVPLLEDLAGLFNEMNMDDPTKV